MSVVGGGGHDETTEVFQQQQTEVRGKPERRRQADRLNAQGEYAPYLNRAA